MQSCFIILITALSLAKPYAFASPIPESSDITALSDVDACVTEALNSTTWTSLNLDKYLSDWAVNVTNATSNNVQSLAASFGSPNFFCGLDQFCNAGQPCVPVDLPAWYALFAIQTWNDYVNSINTAISFTASIISQTLPNIVTDLQLQPKDNVTPVKNLLGVFAAALTIIPFAGPLGIAATAVGGVAQFALDFVEAPTVDKFLSWSNVASSLASVVQDYQANVSTSVKRVIDTPVAAPGGIYAQLEGGRFLGYAQNFSQADLQSQMISAFTVYSLGLALRAQEVFVVREQTSDSCLADVGSALSCREDISGVFTSYQIGQLSSGKFEQVGEIAGKLVSTYGLTKDAITVDPTTCFDNNGKQQLSGSLGNSMPLNSSTPCLFNLLVCDKPLSDDSSIGSYCKTYLGL